MRIAIVHNAKAGDAAHKGEELAQPFRDAGHEVEVHGKRRADIIAAIDSSPDLLVAAGGDGTVAKAARIIFEHGAGESVPLLPLPLGTANNLARSFGIDGDAASLARGLDDLEHVRFDVGRIVAPWGDKLFVESVGTGVLGAILEGERSAAVRLTRAVKEAVRARHLRMEKRVEDFENEVGKAEAVRQRIIADGEDLSGEYVVVEVMSIRSIGPLLPLAPGAELDDGSFDLLLVSLREREAFAEYVGGAHARSANDTTESPGIRRRVREVELSWPESGGHVDDRAWPEAKRWTEGSVTVAVAGSIEVWRPVG